MIIVIVPDEATEATAEDLAAVAFADFAGYVHGHVPESHSVDLRRERRDAERGICGDDGRVVPTRQGRCPVCAGYLHRRRIAPRSAA